MTADVLAPHNSAPSAATAAADAHGELRRASGAGAVGAIAILREIVESRELVYQFARRDLTIRYTQATLGILWALVMPVLVVFSGLLFRVAISSFGGTSSFSVDAAALAVKSVPWAFFAGAISVATQSVLGHANLIAKVYFARETLPISSVIGQLVDLTVITVVMSIALPFLGTDIRWTALWALMLLPLLILFTTGCALLLSCANLFFRDVKYIVQVALNFGIFATPVFFEPQMLGARGARWLMMAPLSPFIEGLGLAVVGGHNLVTPLVVTGARGAVLVWHPWHLVYAIMLSFGVFWTGLRLFRAFSGRFAEMA